MNRSKSHLRSPGNNPAPPRIAHGLAAFCLFCLFCLLTACRTGPELPPVDISQPGWRTLNGQATWRLPSGAPNLAGELTAAIHPNGSIVLEFTKTPLPLVVVRIAPPFWELNLKADDRSYRGRGDPSPRSAWLVLARVLTDRPLPGGWTWEITGPDEWQLEHSRTGERLQGYLRP